MQTHATPTVYSVLRVSPALSHACIKILQENTNMSTSALVIDYIGLNRGLVPREEDDYDDDG